MTDSQINRVKRGVLLLNSRVVIPDSIPGVSKVQQVIVSPILRTVSWEGEYWRFAGELQIKVTYGAVKMKDSPEGMKLWDPDRSLSGYEEKKFYDDGFSDHDEFAEEEYILLEEGPLPEKLTSLEAHSFEQMVEFTGFSPAAGVELPEYDCLVPRVMDVELKVRDERVLDMYVVLVLEEQVNSRSEGVHGQSAVEFRHPLFISSWPPGMAEVLEWQVGFKAGEVLFRDNEILVSGELVIQVIGVEKEGGEREFSNVNTISAISWEIPVPPGLERSSVSGVKVTINKVQEDSAGLAVLGSLYLDLVVEPLPEQFVKEVEQIQLGEPTLPVFADPGTQDGTLDWLKNWANGQCQLQEDDVKPEFFEPVGVCCEDINPDSEEFLSSMDIALGEIPTLEEVMAEFTNSSYQGLDERFESNLRVTEAIPKEYSGQVRKRLTELKFINRTAIQQVDKTPAVDKVIEKNTATKPIGTWTLYMVKHGDTLGIVCRRYGVDPEIVRKRNNLSGQSLVPGTSLWIPKVT